MTRIRRIIYASDFSSASRKAFATALALAKTNRAALTLVHVVVTPMVPALTDSYLASGVWEDIRNEARTWAQKQLAKLVSEARKAGVRVTALLFEGEAPAAQIVRTARSRRADLLVLGTHGRTGLSKLFLGSVAQRVLATAHCPVVTVRGK